MRRSWQLFDTGAAPLGTLHCFPLDVDAAERDVLAALLSPAEHERAARFHTAVLRERFVVAHGRLRELLGAVLGIEPAVIEFGVSSHGKPHLAGTAAGSGTRFNLSHSQSWGAVGICTSREIGVDIECWRPLHDEAALVHRYFSPAEIAAYDATPLPLRQAAFYAGWTRKEAYVKATGRGLALSLDSFDVSLGPGADARLLRASPADSGGPGWSLAAPEAPAGCSLAVVVAARMLRAALLPVD